MPPKKDTKSKTSVRKGKQNEKGADKDEKNKKKSGPVHAAKCKAPLVRGSVMAQRRLPPTVCCPASQGAPVRCCLPGPGCWPC